ncbi:MAG TPA: citramalate synthase [Armatimonadota bacterium]|jgi:2-isopropylmalate synthase
MADNPQVCIYDTTLRDGSQGEGISFSIEDKLKIARRLDAFGVPYIEGGWPGSNPKDIEFFRRIKGIPLVQAKIAAFGSTRRAKTAAEDDAVLRQLIEADTEVVTIFGKSWTLHVADVLRVTPEQNLNMIRDSVAFLKANGREVIFDAEHFFDGYKCDSGYALAALEAAAQGGADWLVLCDTNGGSLPWQVGEIVSAVRARVPVPIGIHPHNDGELGVANAIAAVHAGAQQVQGTINGLGERTGNANLTSIIPILEAKMNRPCLPKGRLAELTEVANTVNEIANVHPNDRQPFVGRHAFAHKAGVHVDAIMKNAVSYEHMAPETVGNTRRVLLSELSGAATLEMKAKAWGVPLEKSAPETRILLAKLAEMEHEGYVFEDAEASFELMVRRHLGRTRRLFDLGAFRVIVERRNGAPVTEATVKVTVRGQEVLTVAEGDGPVNALDAALRKALVPFYPALESIHLTDYKVRVVNSIAGTAAKVRVHIETADGAVSWSTIGVSENIVDASWQALVDAVDYGLMRSNW